MGNRDELILSFDPVVKTLVRKYNYGRHDEDLYQEGMLQATKAVDSALKAGKETREEIIGKVIVWVRNRLIDLKRKAQIKTVDVDSYETGNDDIDLFIVDLRESLSEKSVKVFDMLLAGYSTAEIAEQLGVSARTIYRYEREIKEVLSEKE